MGVGGELHESPEPPQRGAACNHFGKLEKFPFFYSWTFANISLSSSPARHAHGLSLVTALFFVSFQLDVPTTYSHKRQPELVTQSCEISKAKKSKQRRGSGLIKGPIDDGENLHPSGHQTCPQSCPQPSQVTEVKKTAIQGRGHTSLDFLVQSVKNQPEEPLKAHWSIFVAQVRDFRDVEVAPSISYTKA